MTVLTAYWLIVHGFQAILNQNLKGHINYRLHVQPLQGVKEFCLILINKEKIAWTFSIYYDYC